MPDDDKRDDTLDQLPPQVRAQAEEARRLKDEIRQSQQPQETPVAEPQPGDAEPQNNAPATDTPKEPEAKANAEADEWKRKHDALYGKYSSEIGLARTKIRELEGEVERLKAVVATKVAAPKQEVEPGKQFDPQAFADYDGPIQDLAATVAKLEEAARGKDKLIEELSGQVEQRLNQKIEPLQQTVAQREYDLFLDSLRSQVTHLDAINTDPDFLVWLNTANPYDPAGGNFGDTLKAAEARRNVAGVARIFNDFAAQSGKYAPPPKVAEPAPTPRPRNVQPSTTPSAPPQPDKGQRTWTTAEIEKFYSDVAQGKYRGREDEVRAMKREIFQADQQGLVV